MCGGAVSRALVAALVLALPALSQEAPPSSEIPLPEPAPGPDEQGVAPESSASVATVESEMFGDDDVYRTPLAGRPLRTTLAGREIVVEGRDRGKTFAINLGASYLDIKDGDSIFAPIFAGYGKFYFAERRFRIVTSVFVNTFDYAEDFGGPESLFHAENFTIPFPTEEVIDGRSREETSLLWGDCNVWLGAGYRWRIPPGEVDNDLRVGVNYVCGWEYHDRSDDTPDTERVATDTFRHGVRIQLRMDGLVRNLLELPHRGFAFGADYEFTHRDHWRDHGSPSTRLYLKDETRDYSKYSAYAVAAFGIPGLSERHRLVGQIHGGYTRQSSTDRYSSFRLGGGPIPTESADLARAPFPGAGFNQVQVEDYLYFTLEYRYEIFFFLDLHLRGSFGQARVATLKEFRPVNPLRFERRQGYVFSVALTSGFIWESQVYVEYDYTFQGGLLGGDGGSAVLLMWSKSF